MSLPAVPLVNLSASDGPLLPEMLAVVEKLLRANTYIGGPTVEQFEATLAKGTGTRHAIGLNSGTDALALALDAFGVGRGDGVIVPAFTYNATAAAVARLGAIPIPADVDDVTHTLDPASAEAAAAGKRVKALLPVHLFGHPADMDRLNALAKAKGWDVCEDVAQAIGAKWKGKPVGALSRAGAFSFYPTKNLGGCGDGGAVTTDDPAVDRHVRTMRNQGEPPGGVKYRHERVGWNSRLDAIQAGLLQVKWPHLEAWNGARRAAAARYRTLFREAGLDGDVRCPPGDGDAFPVYHLYCLRVPRRDALREHLTARGIGCAVYYPIPVHLQPCFKDHGYREGQCPVSERACREILAIPCWPGLGADAQVRVVNEIKGFYRGR